MHLCIDVSNCQLIQEIRLHRPRLHGINPPVTDGPSKLKESGLIFKKST